jgi:ketosteroid isomerase-like protein
MDSREKLVREWFDRLTKRQFDRLGELLTDDAIMQLVPFDHKAINRHTTITYDDPLRGREQIVALYTHSANIFDELVFLLDEIHLVEGGDTVVVEYRSKGIANPTKRTFNGRYIAVFRVEDGAIALWREYHDPTKFPEAFNPDPVT